jgi:hypothetical protein
VKTPTRLFALASALLALYATPVAAARWGPHGHSEITYDAATGDLYGFDLPPNIAKVMALGSIAPDYFEFDVPAAHAQVDDSALRFDSQGLATSQEEYRALEAKSYRDSYKWHEFYFKAAVAAAQQGDRERAAFLLGYALHNMEDFGTHQGMANLVHATLDGYAISPDTALSDVTQRLALSHVGASMDITRFREALGQEGWQQFRGEGDHQSELLPVFGHDLDKWDPRRGFLPPPADTSWLNDPLRHAFDGAFKGVAGKYQYDVMGHDQIGAGKLIYNFVEGLLLRQDKLLELLDVSDLDIERGPDDPVEPRAKDLSLLRKYFFDAFTFAYVDPKKFAALSADDRALLESTDWLDLAAEQEKLESAALHNLEQTSMAALLEEYKNRIDRLTAIMNNDRETLAWIQKWRQILQQSRAQWDREAHFIVGLKRPSIDGRPPPPPPPPAPPRFYRNAPDPPDSDGGSGRSFDRDPPPRHERANPDCEPGPGGRTWCLR